MAAAATVIALGAYSPAEVQALGLGRITVLSALGEPLRAEIDIPQISAEEANSLKVGVPGPAAFRAAGVEYNAALASVSITLQQRPDGRAFLRVASDKTVNEPFVDLILEVNWSSGRIVRDYTLLFDPAGMRQAAPAAPVAAQLPPPSAPAEAPAPRAAQVQRSAVQAPAAAAPAPARSARQPVESPARAPVQRTPQEAADAQQIKVKPGETASSIAAAHKPNEVSLDQMLVALLRTNPGAFIDNNVNRIKAGAVLSLPTAEQATAVSPIDARQTLVVQSANFNEYRRKLAGLAPVQQVAEADRKASGSLQTSVDDKKQAPASPDKLTLSKGAVQGKSAEAQIAESRQTKEANARVAELSKNISDLSRLQDKAGPAGGPVASAPAASAVRGPAVPVGAAASAAKPATPPITTASAVVVAPAPKASASATAAVKPTPAVTTTATAVLTPAAPAASTPAIASSLPVAAASASVPAASAPALAASAPPSAPVAAVTPTAGTPMATATAIASASTASKPKPVVAPKLPAPEPSLVDDLLENPLVPVAAGGLIALLAGFGLFRLRQRRKSAQVDSSFLESRSQPDSFFGSSGGQRVDTADAAPPGSSLAYSPSQMDAAGDVDPVAEADVYLAYGRDLQAEEILKEALKMNPARIAIHGKLLEIYAKRRDARAFEVIASEAFKLSDGVGSEWDRISELGLALEPENPLYQPGGRPNGKARAVTVAEPVTAGIAASTLAGEPHPEFDAPSSMPMDLDLGDLDLELPSPPAPAFDADHTMAIAMPAAPVPAPDDGSLDWEPFAPDFGSPPVQPLIDTAAPARPDLKTPVSALDDVGMIEFDLDSLSLDLDQAPPGLDIDMEIPKLPDTQQNPMETKLALAQEFHAIGDSEGARNLVEEVVARATGPLKAKAQRFLAELG